MRAVAVTTFGGPEVLEVVELPDPHPGPGQVRVRVAAFAVNPTDTAMRAGWYTHLQGGGPHVPGMDAAGVVDEVGEGVDWRPGDEVMAVVVPSGGAHGAYAEEVVLDAAAVARVPAGLDLATAATLPMNGMTARESLDQLALPAGATLAVTGAAGAYGGYVVELAKVDGLWVVADASEADGELVRGFGADVVLRRGPDIAERIRAEVPGGVDGLADGAVLDAAALPAIRDGGGLAVVRGWRGEPERGITIHRTWVSRRAGDGSALDGLRALVEAGRLTPRLAATYPAAEPGAAAEAHRRLEAGGTRGRLVLTW